MKSPTVQLDLTHAARVYVATFDTSAEADTWLAQNPLAVRVCRAPGLLMFPGQSRLVVAEYRTPAEQIQASETLKTLEGDARRKYLRASQAKVRLNKITSGDLGKI